MPKVDSNIYKFHEKKKRFLEREQVIVNSAIQLAKKQGLADITISLIAKHAGIGKGTIYKHFISKSEILMRILLDHEQKTTANIQLDMMMIDRDPFALIHRYLKMRLADPELDRLMQHLEGQLKHDARVAKSMAQFFYIKNSNVASINKAILLLVKKGVLRDAPSSHHYFSYLALVQGAVDLSLAENFQLDIDDRAIFLGFIAEVGITMGKTVS
jgi:TetR/AcrR family transcriptional regulator